MKEPSVNLKKLDDRSRTVVYLGKEPGAKAYRLLDPDTKRIYVSRDVVFEERKPWNWDETEESPSMHTGSFSVFTENSDGNGDNDTVERTPRTYTGNDLEDTNGKSVQNSTVSSLDCDTDETPQKYRPLSEVYDSTEPIEMEDAELYLMGVDEPTNFSQATQEVDSRKAMQAEMEAVERNSTWTLTTLPKGRKAIDLKWIYKIKRDAAGNITKHKARIIVKGYVQRQEVDFDEVFAPVTRIETIRLLLALAAKGNWEVHHLDVKIAFLNGEIKEEAPRAWYSKLNQCLEGLNFVRCAYEQAVYMRRMEKEMLIVGVYVDDLLVTGTNLDSIREFKEQMAKNFDMSDLGKLTYYLGIEVKQGDGFIQLKQTGYVKNILSKAGMLDCNPTKVPMRPNEILNKDEGGILVDPTGFKSMIGGLRYLVHTRPDLAYSVGIVSRFMEKPTLMHQNAAKRILRYVKGTLNLGLIYTANEDNNIVIGYSDSDLAGNIENRKSTGGMVFYLNKSLITWNSQKQKCVALSSCEAEFMVATVASCQAVWLRKLLSKIIGLNIPPVTLFIDNKSAIDLAKNPVFHGRSKHIDIRFHFIRECIENGDIVVKHICNEEQRADSLTKALSAARFERMRSLLGVRNCVQDFKNNIDVRRDSDNFLRICVLVLIALLRHVQGICDNLTDRMKQMHDLDVDPVTDIVICCGQTEAFAATMFAKYLERKRKKKKKKHKQQLGKPSRRETTSLAAIVILENLLVLDVFYQT
ncbi:hypothetical protein AgCh_023059 [Apium graveolens]